ncbi:hypothetical protein AYO20_01463 [Fonsecaea nubica]|uniref:Uncharacterized protein n=1 Tax=Fonsecaea nubica TaxID=856822 RepID=A0A178DDJ5_9EURO|nr:hypothetical protein AYO20_01463 [Fonsecaea nubica]OAL39145.1 hypothetical protein AYO20_01463 [Fonsecaea nubica]
MEKKRAPTANEKRCVLLTKVVRRKISRGTGSQQRKQAVSRTLRVGCRDEGRETMSYREPVQGSWKDFQLVIISLSIGLIAFGIGGRHGMEKDRVLRMESLLQRPLGAGDIRGRACDKSDMGGMAESSPASTVSGHTSTSYRLGQMMHMHMVGYNVGVFGLQAHVISPYQEIYRDAKTGG